MKREKEEGRPVETRLDLHLRLTIPRSRPNPQRSVASFQLPIGVDVSPPPLQVTRDRDDSSPSSTSYSPSSSSEPEPGFEGSPPDFDTPQTSFSSRPSGDSDHKVSNWLSGASDPLVPVPVQVPVTDAKLDPFPVPIPGSGLGSKLGDEWNMILSESEYSDREVRVIMVDKITMDRLVRLRAGRVGM